MSQALLAVLTSIFLLSSLGCGNGDEGGAIDSPTGPEITPEEFAQEMGLDPNPKVRKVPSSDFSSYPLVVDIFRRSSDRPVLGEFLDAYVDLLVPAGFGTPAERAAEARRVFADLRGKEFAIISVNGAPYKAQIISGGLERRAQGAFRTTPPGAYKLDIIQYTKKIPAAGGGTRSARVDYPWLRSSTYGNSIMYWGLWMFGGYFIHSTTHYGQLGVPASMGCIRQAYPDAMELFRLRQAYRGMIRVHPIGSTQAVNRYAELTTAAWLLPRLVVNRQNIANYIRYAGSEEISLQGHAWVDSATGRPGAVEWPDCGPVDCFRIWGRKMPASSGVSTFADGRAMTLGVL